ncbi:Uncharacterised protein, partial [Metamycoplasma alkalescens]
MTSVLFALYLVSTGVNKSSFLIIKSRFPLISSELDFALIVAFPSLSKLALFKISNSKSFSVSSSNPDIFFKSFKKSFDFQLFFGLISFFNLEISIFNFIFGSLLLINW